MRYPFFALIFGSEYKLKIFFSHTKFYKKIIIAVSRNDVVNVTNSLLENITTSKIDSLYQKLQRPLSRKLILNFAPYSQRERFVKLCRIIIERWLTAHFEALFMVYEIGYVTQNCQKTLWVHFSISPVNYVDSLDWLKLSLDEVRSRYPTSKLSLCGDFCDHLLAQELLFS